MESATENQVPMEDKLAARFAELEEKIKNMPQEEQDRVRDAYTYAKEHHDGQLRKDGSPYITHPLEVAHLVADLGLDADSIIAALLHDTIEDTDATHEEVAKRFGVTVANLVEGVTKLNKVKYTSTEEKQMENLRKMLMAMATFISPSTAQAVPCLISMENAGISILSRTPALPVANPS